MKDINAKWLRERIGTMRMMGTREPGKETEWSRGWNQAVNFLEGGTLSDSALDLEIERQRERATAPEGVALFKCDHCGGLLRKDAACHCSKVKP